MHLESRDRSTRSRLGPLVLAAVLLACGARGALAKGPSKEDAKRRAKDVEFLLDAFESKAKALLREKDVDWKKVRKEFGGAVKKVKDDVEHLKLVARLVARLQDGHAAIVDSKVPWPDESEGRRFTGPRVHLLVADDGVYVRAAFGEAASAGVSVGMEVREIDGEKAIDWVRARADALSDQTGYSTRRGAMYAACHFGLADWSGTPIAFTLHDGKERKKVRIVRNGGPNYAPFGPVHAPPGVQSEGRQLYGRTPAGFGYVHLRDVPGELPAQLDRMLAALGDVPGLVLDLRANAGGGCDHDAVFGRFLPEGERLGGHQSAGAAPYGGPVVVIVDAGVASAGETVASMLKEDGRAFVIGDEPTAGMSSQKETVTTPSGLFTVRFSVASNMQRSNGGRGLEGIGVISHETVPYDPAELRSGVDTQIRRAEELLRDGFPRGVVRWQPPKR